MKDNWIKGILTAALVLATGLAFGTWAYKKQAERKTYSELKKFEEKGYDSLALELAEEHRHSLTNNKEKCETMINLYHRTQIPARLEWAAQSCLSNGVDTPMMHLGFAAAREMMKDNDRALAVVANGLKKHEDDIDLMFRAGILLKNMNRLQESAAILQKAATQSPDNLQIASNAFFVLYELGMWKEAYPFAKIFKVEQLDNPSLGLMLTRVYLNNEDMKNAAQSKEKSVALMAQLKQQGRSEVVETLEKNFASELSHKITMDQIKSDRVPASN